MGRVKAELVTKGSRVGDVIVTKIARDLVSSINPSFLQIKRVASWSRLISSKCMPCACL